MWELVMSARALARTPTDPIHRGWASDAHRALLASPQMSLLRTLVRDGLGPPHFLLPPPLGPRPSFEGELDRIATVPREMLYVEFGWIFGETDRWREPYDALPPHMRCFVDEPERTMERLLDELRLYWRLVLAPQWQKTSEFLERTLERIPAHAASAEVAPALDSAYRRDDEGILLTNHYAGSLRLAPEEEVVLVASAFSWPRPCSIACPATNIAWAGRPAMLAFVAPGFADLWKPSEASEETLAKLLGRSRASILRALEARRSTTQLADALRLTPGGVSQQLAILHEAGLVHRDRERHTVYYSLSRRGKSLLDLFEDGA
jgi:DNA-binding HxlR family transcriptional regulator